MKDLACMFLPLIIYLFVNISRGGVNISRGSFKSLLVNAVCKLPFSKYL